MAHREARATEQASVEPVAAEPSIAAAGGLGGFAAFTPALVVSLQRSAGNVAGSRMLSARGQMVQRDDGARVSRPLRAMGPEGIINFAKNADELRVITRFGLDARNELTRSRDHGKVFGHLLEILHDLDEVEAAKLVQKVLAERTLVKRENALDLPARPKRRSSRAGRGSAASPKYLRHGPIRGVPVAAGGGA